MYVKDNRLHYVNSFVGTIEQKVVATEDVPTGKNLILSASFDKDGEDPPTCPPGSSRCTTATRRSARAGSRRSLEPSRSRARVSAWGETAARAVTDDYPGETPHRFTGGMINRVAVDVSGEPYLDLEREAQAMMARE